MCRWFWICAQLTTCNAFFFTTGVQRKKTHFFRGSFHQPTSSSKWVGETDYPSPCTPQQHTCKLFTRAELLMQSKSTQKYLFETKLFVEMISFSIESPCLNFVATQWSKVHGEFWTKHLHLTLQVYFNIQWNRDLNKFRSSQCRQIAFSEKCGN